jgi:eukaryotic translation initiation factor 2C
MYSPGPLIQLCLKFLGNNNPNILTRQLPDRQRVSLGRFIAGIRVKTKDAGSGAERTRVVRKLTREGANEITFTLREGRSMTVANYFRETTGRALQFPNLFCVEVSSHLLQKKCYSCIFPQIGQGALIPLELCTVPQGQLMRKEIPDDKKTQLVEFASMRPPERLQSIQRGMGVSNLRRPQYFCIQPNIPGPRLRQFRICSQVWIDGRSHSCYDPGAGFEGSSSQVWS